MVSLCVSVLGGQSSYATVYNCTCMLHDNLFCSISGLAASLLMSVSLAVVVVLATLLY